MNPQLPSYYIPSPSHHIYFSPWAKYLKFFFSPYFSDTPFCPDISASSWLPFCLIPCVSGAGSQRGPPELCFVFRYGLRWAWMVEPSSVLLAVLLLIKPSLSEPPTCHLKLIHLGLILPTLTRIS